MRISEYLHSDQFEWALWQSCLSAVATVLAGVSAYVLGEASWKVTLALVIGALLGIVNRLREGIADAQRNDANAVLPRDVTGTNEPKP